MSCLPRRRSWRPSTERVPGLSPTARGRRTGLPWVPPGAVARRSLDLRRPPITSSTVGPRAAGKLSCDHAIPVSISLPESRRLAPVSRSRIAMLTAPSIFEAALKAIEISPSGNTLRELGGGAGNGVTERAKAGRRSEGISPASTRRCSLCGRIFGKNNADGARISSARESAKSVSPPMATIYQFPGDTARRRASQSWVCCASCSSVHSTSPITGPSSFCARSTAASADTDCTKSSVPWTAALIRPSVRASRPTARRRAAPRSTAVMTASTTAEPAAPARSWASRFACGE